MRKLRPGGMSWPAPGHMQVGAKAQLYPHENSADQRFTNICPQVTKGPVRCRLHSAGQGWDPGCCISDQPAGEANIASQGIAKLCPTLGVLSNPKPSESFWHLVGWGGPREGDLAADASLFCSQWDLGTQRERSELKTGLSFIELPLRKMSPNVTIIFKNSFCVTLKFLLIYFLFLSMLCSTRDLSSPTRGGTHIPYSGSIEP